MPFCLSFMSPFFLFLFFLQAGPYWISTFQSSQCTRPIMCMNLAHCMVDPVQHTLNVHNFPCPWSLFCFFWASNGK
ncbi:hypothetical protein I7I50_07750 [Histoplasma capsulatum G186AR]|uniref:Secreted protein n=1 Tax=Ajellomyces capsulatus TaxID=5037 RepID=A0A8H8D2V0_AJECA|nr:hypothetical protein I7I52_09177 [Histoplasma capsulatum]QSS68367.1 hypothetical protein I7I50_07750 [Histoplasma capsulatum G186AR]